MRLPYLPLMLAAEYRGCTRCTESCDVKVGRGGVGQCRVNGRAFTKEICEASGTRDVLQCDLEHR